jgi:hypothetical protein
MSARDELDRRLADWMTEDVSGPPPAERFEQAMEAATRRRPRPRWLAAFGSDWLGTDAPRRGVPAWPGLSRKLVVAAAVVLLIAAAIAGAALVGAQLLRPDRNPLPKPESNGWITFDADDGTRAGALGDHDIYLVGQNRSAKRIVGTDSDNLDQLCPGFSADATRLAFGQAQGTSATGYRDSALVVADIDADGIVSAARTIPVGGTFPPLCPIWSPDGQRIAFILPGARNAGDPQPAGAGDVWVVTLDSEQVTVLPGMWAGDLDWAPDGSRLAIASGAHPQALPVTGGPLLLYSVANGEVSQLRGASAVTSLAWSPDGSRIAFQRIRTPATPADGGIVVGTETREIWTIGPDGSGGTLQTDPFDVNQGMGPVWSPAGDRIVYQRVCATLPPGQTAPCREQHDVVLLTPGTTLSETNPVGSEVVLPLARVDGAGAPSTWWPFQVSWSPDGQKLLYTAWDDQNPTGLVVVDVDSGSPPIVAYQGGDIGGGDGDISAGGLWIRSWSSWGRLPGSLAGSPAR